MLYKYLSASRVTVLENLEIRFSQPQALNDPFEALPLIDNDADRRVLIDKLQREANKIWDNIPKSERTSENYDLFQKQVSKPRAHIYSKLDPSIIGGELMKLLRNNLGVLSLSRNFNNLLMWSHYTDGHKGFVIGFEDSHSFFSEKTQNSLSSKPTNVCYTSQRGIVSKSDIDYYKKILGRKPIDWAYEEEVRVFRWFTKQTKKAGLDDSGYQVFLVDVPKDSIKRIYIGANASSDVQKGILRAIQRHALEVELFIMRFSKERYQLEWECI